ncbi:MAG: ABC transporter substrate-binding protein [Halolamina sp.]
MPDRQGNDTDDGRRKFLKAGGAAAVSLGVAGCSGGDATETPTPSPTEESTPTEQSTPTATPEQEVATGGTLTYGMSANPDTSNILRSGSVYSAVALATVYEYGLRSDPITYDPKPWVFTDWKIENTEGSDAKPDVYMNMRDGLTWADGEEFTADDVIFSYRYVIENEPAELAGFVDAVESIEKADGDWDFHVKMAKKIGQWEGTVVGGCPFLPPQQWEGKDLKKFEPVEGSDGEAFSLGPGKLTRFSPDTAMQVVFREDGEPVNPSFHEKLSNLKWREDHKQIIAGGPFLDKVNFKVFGSESAMTQAFLQGEIDTHYGSIKNSEIETVEENEGQSLVNGFDSGFSYYGYNVRRKPLGDVAFRQALAFMWDEFYWVERLQGGNSIKGDYPHSPGYRAARPETNFDGELLTDPASEAFTFRSGSAAAVPDYEGIKQFLKDGKVLTGEGTFVGKDYPGTLSGVGASYSEAQHDYSWGSVESEVLKNTKGVDQEIRVNGKTIPEMRSNGKPLEFLIDPPQQAPREAKAIENWVGHMKKLGIPVKTTVLSFNTMVSKVYSTEEYDIYTMGWGGTDPYGDSLYFFFHTDNADTTGDKDSFVYNSTGYGMGEAGYDEELLDAYQTTDLEKMGEKFAKANERIYLDQPYMTRGYSEVNWPINSADFAGYVGNVVDPAFASWSFEAYNLHTAE